MIEVKITDLYPNDIIDIVKELRDQGYVQGIDFDFEYHQPKYLDWAGDVEYNRYTIFKFYKEELATWFNLKYL